MQKPKQTIETLALVADPTHTEQVAQCLNSAGIATHQHWVDDTYSFAECLARQDWDLVIITLTHEEWHIPSCILRYPDTPFVAITQKNKSAMIDYLLEHGITDAASFSRPARLKHALHRALTEANTKRAYQLARRQAAEKGKLLNQLLESSSEPIAFVHQGLHSFVNPAYLAMTGLEDTLAASATPLVDLVASQHQDALKQCLRKFNKPGTPGTRFDTRLHDENGNAIPVSLSMSAAQFEGEPVVQIVARPLAQLEQESSTVTARGKNQVLALKGTTKETQRKRNPRVNSHQVIAINERYASVPESPSTPLKASSKPLRAAVPQPKQTETLDESATLTAADPEWIARISAVLNSSGLRISLRPINSLRVDTYERYQLNLALQTGDSGIQSVEKLIAEARRHQLLGGLDRWALYNAASELAKRLRERPNTRFFVHLHASQLTLDEMIPWLKLLLKRFSLPASSLNVMLDGGGLTDNAKLSNATIGRLKNLNIGVGLCGLNSDTGLNATSLHEHDYDRTLNFELLEVLPVDFALLDPAINEELSNPRDNRALQRFLHRCQAASITTMVEANSAQSLSTLWKMGADCFIGNPSEPEIGLSKARKMEQLDLTSAL